MITLAFSKSTSARPRRRAPEPPAPTLHPVALKMQRLIDVRPIAATFMDQLLDRLLAAEEQRRGRP